MKTKKKLCLKVMSLVMACLLCFQFCSNIGYAAEKSESWTLYYNPASPSAEWLTKCRLAISSNKDYTTFFVSEIEAGVKIHLYVANAVSGGSKDFNKANDTSVGYRVKVKKGHVYTYEMSYVDCSDYVNLVRGHINYYN